MSWHTQGAQHPLLSHSRSHTRRQRPPSRRRGSPQRVQWQCLLVGWPRGPRAPAPRQRTRPRGPCLRSPEPSGRCGWERLVVWEAPDTLEGGSFEPTVFFFARTHTHVAVRPTARSGTTNGFSCVDRGVPFPFISLSLSHFPHPLAHTRRSSTPLHALAHQSAPTCERPSSRV